MAEQDRITKEKAIVCGLATNTYRRLSRAPPKTAQQSPNFSESFFLLSFFGTVCGKSYYTVVELKMIGRGEMIVAAPPKCYLRWLCRVWYSEFDLTEKVNE